ncbi:MAG: ArsR family transcriptional regulator [Spirochaetes bacterium]|nr:ArsR family transcriptional regulator [Spirochaetota bacterium]MBX3720818.1 ArsR family transcriptional regulator [Turneriella sp.]
MIQALPLFKALVEPVRIRIYLLLKKSPLTVSELSEILDLSQSNTSHHIKALRDLGLLSAEKTGQHTYYGLDARELAGERTQKLLESIAELGAEIPETKNDATKLRNVLAARSEDTFAAWRLEQPDLPYSDIFAHVAAGRRGTVLDIGCGEGDFFEALSLSYDRVTGIELDRQHSSRAAAAARDKTNIEVVTADAQNLPIAAASVDAVVLRMALSQIPDPLVALDEATRVLKPGGCLSLIDAEKKTGDAFLRKITAHIQSGRALRLDFERALPRLFMLRAVKKIQL